MVVPDDLTYTFEIQDVNSITAKRNVDINPGDVSRGYGC